MAPRGLINNFNMHHRFWSHTGAPQSYLHEPYNKSSAQVPGYGTKAYHQHKGHWGGGHDGISILPTSTGDTVFQRLYERDDDCGIGRFPSHNFYSDDRWKHGNIPLEWRSISPELRTWAQTSDAQSALGAEVTVSAGLIGNPFQSTMASLQRPILANPGMENFNSYLHGFSGTEEILDVTDIEFANLFQRNTAPFEQGRGNLCLLDEPTLSTPFNNEFDTTLLEHTISNKQDSIPVQSPHYQELSLSFPNTSNHGQSFSFPWNRLINDEPQLGSFDDIFTVLPMQTLETTYIPQDPITFTRGSQPSSLSVNECLPISSAYYYPENTSMIPAPPSLLSDTLQYGTSHSPGNFQHHQSPRKIMRENKSITTLKPKLVAKETQLPKQTNWQHTSSTELKPHQIVKDGKQKRRIGRRHGRLNPEIAKNAREMRHLRACLPCVIMKMRCSPGDTCTRCSTLGPQSLGKRICTRAHLEDFSDLLFPVPFVSHLGPKSVEQLSSELSLGFVGIDIEVALTCGSEYPPLNLAVSEFALKSDQAARIATVNIQSQNDLPLFEYRCPPPIASRSAYNDLFERCRNHIKLVVKQERALPSPILKQGHEISRLALKAITRHCGSIPHASATTTLEKAMMLHAIYKFMATTITITESSKGQLSDYLRKPAMIEYDSSIACRLLNRQIKSTMHALRERLMREVLEELEKELRTRSKAVWAPCFCVALILCMCVEEAQIAMDAFAMHTRALGAMQDAPSSQTTIESCRKLDDLLFNHLLDLFHGVYKTHQTSKPQRSCRVYNPIRDGPETNIKEGLDQKSADLVSEFRGIIADHKDEIVERAATPSFVDDHDSLARHMAFRNGNSARLVSSFLKSFYQP